jgi:hypothetical protein
VKGVETASNTPMFLTLLQFLSNASVPVAWCLAITAVGYLWATHLYNHRPG